MKKTIKFSLLLLILSSSLFAAAQENILEHPESKFTHSIGIQYNPYLNQSTFSSESIQNVYAIRYGLGYNGTTIGLELFDYTYSQHAAKGNTIGLGVYARYAYLRSKSVSPFAEISGFYSSSKTTILDERLIQEGVDQYTNNKMGYYIAPGFSIKIYKTKVSLDLMLKMSTSDLINGTHFVPSYKINYHF